MFKALQQITDECSTPGWDGYGAEPVDPASVSVAERFVSALPADMDMPEFGVDPDGEVSANWCASRRQTFSISFNPDGKHSYAWISGEESGYGSFVWA